MKAGAASVLAVDIDPWTETAIRLNAALNGVDVSSAGLDMIGTGRDADVYLAGDVFYDKAFADRIVPWLSALAKSGADVLVGDPGRAYCPRDRMEMLATYQVPVTGRWRTAKSRRPRSGGFYRGCRRLRHRLILTVHHLRMTQTPDSQEQARPAVEGVTRMIFGRAAG